MNAAKLTGTPWYKMIVKHIMPNIMGPIIVTRSFGYRRYDYEFGRIVLSGFGCRYSNS